MLATALGLVAVVSGARGELFLSVEWCDSAVEVCFGVGDFFATT